MAHTVHRIDELINTARRKANQKLHALFRISHLSWHEKLILFKTFITSKFDHCPLVWISHNRGLNNKINNINKKSSKNSVSRQKIKFTGFIAVKDKSVSVHMKNLKHLATEIYKVKIVLYPRNKEVFVF